MKLTIIETGQAPEAIRADWPDYPAMFEALLAPYLPGWSYEAIALSQGEPLPDPSVLNAILITGSPAGVYDDVPWMAPLMDFIRGAGAERIPQIGICFGHQAIAKAFGAQVSKSDKGWGIGRHVYDIHTRPNWLDSYSGDTFSLGVSHQDQVHTLPPGAELVAASAFTPYAAVNYPKQNAMSFQGHPEFSPEFSCALYHIRRGGALSEELVNGAEKSFAQPIDLSLIHI